MSDSPELQMLIAIVQRLETKVDTIQNTQVTRSEFESMRHSLDTFVLKREFEVYRDAHDQWAATVLAGINTQIAGAVPRTEFESKARDHDFKLAELSSSRHAWKKWMPTILGTFAALAGAAATWFHK